MWHGRDATIAAFRVTSEEERDVIVSEPRSDARVRLPEDRVRAARGDLRELLRLADEAGVLTRVDGADPELEIGALHELSLERQPPPVLLFDRIKGFAPGYRIVTNVQECAVFAPERGLAAVRAARERSRAKLLPIPPVEVATGPLFENVVRGDDVNVLAFPAPRWHADDGGRYIGTQCVVIARDPGTGWVNLGTYRVMVQDERTLSVFIEPGKDGDHIRRRYWERGEACPIAVCVGQAPVLAHVAGQHASHGESEYGLAGAILGRPIEVVRGPVTGLPLPAGAEIVMEGVMPPADVEARPEGPFGEWPGYYASPRHLEPVVRVAAIYHRDDPIVTGDPPVKPTYPGRTWSAVAKAAAIWDALEAAGVPGVTGVWKLRGGGPRFITVVAIRQMYAGHAKMAGLVAAGCGPGAFLGRMVIVVDDDIDITDPAEVLWALATRWDPKTQTDVVEGMRSAMIDPRLDPEKRARGDLTSSRAIFYAVRPYEWKDRFPPVSNIDPAYAEEVRRKWQALLPYLRDGGD
jgi:4-hydroxy-3-polyprenylbenzoate decarboxylase